MFKVAIETEKYKITNLFESELICIKFVEDKQDRQMDRIKFIRLGNGYADPEIVVFYRYEDEQALEQIVSMYREQEV